MLTVIGAWTATTVRLSNNGAAFVSAGNANIPTVGGTVYIAGTGVQVLDSDAFWFACGTGTLSDADAAAIHAWGNSDPPPGLFPPAADLTMIWRAIDSTARKYA